MKKLFDWQENCIQLWFENNCRGIVNVVTGAGKTILALGAINRLESRKFSDNLIVPGKLKVKIVVPKTFLIGQWTKAIRKELGETNDQIGTYFGGHKDKISKKYMIYVVNSARYTLARHVISDLKNGDTVLLICDECHHYSSKENFRIFDFLPMINEYKSNYLSLGLSATPKTNNYETTLIPALGNEIYRYDFTKARKAKIICNCSIFNVKLEFNPLEKQHYEELSDKIIIQLRKLYLMCPYLKSLKSNQFFVALQGLEKTENIVLVELSRIVMNLFYKRKEIVYLADSRIRCIIELIKKLPENSRIIIFGERIESADDLFDSLNRVYKGQVGKYHSLMSDYGKKNSLAKYESSEFRIMVSCRSLDEGLNIPQTDVGIVISSSGSARQRIQRLGRILRRKEKDTTSNFYYLYIANSSEEEVFMPADVSGEMKVYNINFDYKDNSFGGESFDVVKEKAVEIASVNKILSLQVAEEFNKNIETGLVRNEWQASETYCQEMIKSATTIENKNYWISLLFLAKASAELGEN